MEVLVNKRNYEEPLYEIMGKDKETIQLILMPNQSILTKKLHILYASDNIHFQNNTNLKTKIKNIIKGTTIMDTVAKNKSDSLGYMNLNMNSGMKTFLLKGG